MPFPSREHRAAHFQEKKRRNALTHSQFQGMQQQFPPHFNGGQMYNSPYQWSFSFGIGGQQAYQVTYQPLPQAPMFQGYGMQWSSSQLHNMSQTPPVAQEQPEAWRTFPQSWDTEQSNGQASHESKLRKKTETAYPISKSSPPSDLNQPGSSCAPTIETKDDPTASFLSGFPIENHVLRTPTSTPHAGRSERTMCSTSSSASGQKSVPVDTLSKQDILAHLNFPASTSPDTTSDEDCLTTLVGTITLAKKRFGSKDVFFNGVLLSKESLDRFEWPKLYGGKTLLLLRATINVPIEWNVVLNDERLELSSATTHIVVIGNQNKCHWIVIHFNIADHRMTWWDSINGKETSVLQNREAIRAAKNQVATALEISGRQRCPIPWIDNYSDKLQQTDDHSCGPLAWELMERLLGRTDLKTTPMAIRLRQCRQVLARTKNAIKKPVGLPLGTASDSTVVCDAGVRRKSPAFKIPASPSETTKTQSEYPEEETMMDTAVSDKTMSTTTPSSASTERALIGSSYDKSWGRKNKKRTHNHKETQSGDFDHDTMAVAPDVHKTADATDPSISNVKKVTIRPSSDRPKRKPNGKRKHEENETRSGDSDLELHMFNYEIKLDNEASIFRRPLTAGPGRNDLLRDKFKSMNDEIGDVPQKMPGVGDDYQDN